MKGVDAVGRWVLTIIFAVSAIGAALMGKREIAIWCAVACAIMLFVFDPREL